MSSLVQYYSADMLGVATWKHMHTTGLTWYICSSIGFGIAEHAI